MISALFSKSPFTTGLKISCSALALAACLAAGGAQAADKGPRQHARGQYDTVTATYLVVEGDDLVAISERFEIPVDLLKQQNKLASNEIEVGRKLIVATSAAEGGPAGAPQITGVPGSPSATTTISGEQLPPLPEKFGGKIERNAAQSTPYWPPRVEPPKGAPNVLLIMTDDVGFGAPSTFGGIIAIIGQRGDPLDEHFYALIQFRQGLELIEPLALALRENKEIFRAIVPLQGGDDSLLAALTAAVPQSRECRRIALASQNCGNDGLSAHTVQIAEDMVDFQIHLGEHLLHEQHLPGQLRDQSRPVAHEVAQRQDVLGGTE